MSNFTPGPWKIKSTVVSEIVVDSNDLEVAELWHPYEIIRDPETLEPYDNSDLTPLAPEYNANARLVVSAPEMAELLDDVLVELGIVSSALPPNQRGHVDALHDRIDTLLRQIEGRDEK